MVDKEDGTEKMMRNKKHRPVELTVHKKRTERDDKIFTRQDRSDKMM